MANVVSQEASAMLSPRYFKQSLLMQVTLLPNYRKRQRLLNSCDQLFTNGKEATVKRALDGSTYPG